MFSRTRLFTFIYIVVLFGVQLNARMLPTKEDCNDLWNVLGKQGNAIGSLRKVQTKGLQDANTLVRLYEDCLRAEEGIRYRRSGQPGFWLDQATMQAIDSQQKTAPVQSDQVSPPQGQIENERQFLAKLRAILSRM